MTFPTHRHDTPWLREDGAEDDISGASGERLRALICRRGEPRPLPPRPYLGHEPTLDLSRTASYHPHGRVLIPRSDEVTLNPRPTETEISQGFGLTASRTRARVL